MTYVDKFYAVVVNGEEKHKASSMENARSKAERLRKRHGAYAVWIRPHFMMFNQ